MSQLSSPPCSLSRSEILPPRKAPIASHTTHDPIMIPIENSFPEKMMSISLSRIVWATIPLKPTMITAKMKCVRPPVATLIAYKGEWQRVNKIRSLKNLFITD